MMFSAMQLNSAILQFHTTGSTCMIVQEISLSTWKAHVAHNILTRTFRNNCHRAEHKLTRDHLCPMNFSTLSSVQAELRSAAYNWLTLQYLYALFVQLLALFEILQVIILWFIVSNETLQQAKHVTTNFKRMHRNLAGMLFCST